MTMASCPAYNCSFQNNGTIPFEGDPDIAGIGNIVAFMVSSWLPFIGVCWPYMKLYCKRLFFAHDPDIGLELWLPPVFSPVYQETILAMSDSQLVTGVAILLVGFIKHCTITQYHFSVVHSLGHMSFATHQSTYLILGEYFSCRAKTSWLRIALITVLVILVGLSELLSVNTLFLGTWGQTTQCIWDNMSGNYTASHLGPLVVFIMFVLWGYVDIVSCLLHSSFRTKLNKYLDVMFFVPRHVLNSPGYLCIMTEQVALRQGRSGLFYFWKSLGHLSLRVFSIVLSARRSLPSTPFNLIRIWVFLFWTTGFLFKTRSKAEDNGMTDSENEWGFGQQVAVLLIFLPLLALLDAYSESRAQAKASLNILSTESTRLFSISVTSVTEPRMPVRQRGIVDRLDDVEKDLLASRIFVMFLASFFMGLSIFAFLLPVGTGFYI